MRIMNLIGFGALVYAGLGVAPVEASCKYLPGEWHMTSSTGVSQDAHLIISDECTIGVRTGGDEDSFGDRSWLKSHAKDGVPIVKDVVEFEKLRGAYWLTGECRHLVDNKYECDLELDRPATGHVATWTIARMSMDKGRGIMTGSAFKTSGGPLATASVTLVRRWPNCSAEPPEVITWTPLRFVDQECVSLYTVDGRYRTPSSLGCNGTICADASNLRSEVCTVVEGDQGCTVRR